MTATMTTKDAIAIVVEAASTWGENYEEQFPKRLEATTTDEEIYGLANGDTDEVDEMTTLRDVWRAIELLNREFLTEKGE